MLQNAYFLVKIGADTAENEQHSAEILPTDARRAPADEGVPHRRAQQLLREEPWGVGHWSMIDWYYT